MRDRDIDANIGQWIRYSREKRGLTQRDVGNILGVSHTQIQKYEKGINSISAAKLWKIAKHFNVRMESFLR